MRDNRAAVNLSDVVMTFFVFVALVVCAPILYYFIGIVSDVADPFSSVMLQFMIPLFFIALLVSVGVSAR